MSHRDENELSHDPVPGYKPVFFIVVIAAALYLAAVFLMSVA